MTNIEKLKSIQKIGIKVKPDQPNYDATPFEVIKILQKIIIDQEERIAFLETRIIEMLTDQGKID